MKRIFNLFSKFSLIIALVFGILVSTQAVSAVTVSIPIISVNDFHGQIDETSKNPGLLKMTQFIENERALNPNLIFLSAGDSFQGSAKSNLTYGDTLGFIPCP